MNEQITPPSSKTGNILSAVGASIVLLLFGFFPFRFIALVTWEALEEPGRSTREVFHILSFTVFLAMIAVILVLMLLAIRSSNNEAKATGVYSVIFGGVPILFAVHYHFFQQFSNTGGAFILFITILPTQFLFPFIGLALGKSGFKSTWGKVGLILSVGQWIFWATLLIIFNWEWLASPRF